MANTRIFSDSREETPRVPTISATKRRNRRRDRHPLADYSNRDRSCNYSSTGDCGRKRSRYEFTEEADAFRWDTAAPLPPVIRASAPSGLRSSYLPTTKIQWEDPQLMRSAVRGSEAQTEFGERKFVLLMHADEAHHSMKDEAASDGLYLAKACVFPLKD